VEIAASQFAEWDIDMEVCRWHNVGMSEKPGRNPAYVASLPISSLRVNRLFKDLATIVHSEPLCENTYGLSTCPVVRNMMKYSKT
jgi:hypothetical protein